MTDPAVSVGPLFQQGLELHKAGQVPEAQEVYRQVLAQQPKHFDALHMLGVIAIQSQHLEQALSLINQAIAIDPNNRAYAPAYSNRGIALKKLGRAQAALESFEKSLDLSMSQADVHYNRGTILRDLKHYRDAIESFDQVIRLAPKTGAAYMQRALSLNDLGQYQAAAASFAQAIKISPDQSEAYNGFGIALSVLNKHEAAAGHFRKAVELDPSYAAAFNNLGNALRALGRFEEALASYDSAIALAPSADTYNNRATTLIDLKRPQGVIESFDKVLEINPSYPFVRGQRLHAQMYICDWKDFEARKNDLVVRVENGEVVTPSWPLLALTGSLAQQARAAEIWAATRSPENPALGPIFKRPKPDKIRIGYYSADYHNHATMHLMAELFERHDRTKFELFAFSFGPDKNDATRQRVAAAFDSFVDVRAHADQDVAALSRKLEIDIAVDLKGFTQDCRSGIFASRAAPLQVNYLGYPGTMGTDYIDYIIGDETVISSQEQRYYREKVITLPGSYQVNDAHRRIADRVFSRLELGLPETGFVFCCFNNNYKILPSVFDMWMRILKRIDGSVLWLFQDNPLAAANLRKEAVARGVDAPRLIFATRTPLAEHLARHRAADLFLDTLPYNAHTTASDALWAGLPVLTCTGASFAGRVAASLLRAVNLPELITATPKDYEALAVALATDPARLAQIRKKLGDNRLSAPLFNAAPFTKHIEDAYTQIFERYHAGLAPEHLRIGVGG